MKSSLKTRLHKLEGSTKMCQTSRYAKVIYDPNIPDSTDLSFAQANCTLCLPDNGRRVVRDKLVCTE